MRASDLPLRNLSRKPGRTAALMLLAGFLALSLFAGTVVVESLGNGLKSLEARLGADIIVVPASAKARVNLQEMLLQGATGSFYTDAKYTEMLAGVEGVEKASPQLFLASLRADCCSVAVQVIGIDQKTDFTVQPWIARSYSREMGIGDVVVGSRVNAQVGEGIKLYDTRCRVVARLDATGTAMDTCVYCGMDTLRMLLEAAREKGHELKIEGEPENVISAVYLKVRDGADPQKVTDTINVQNRFKKLQAVRTKSMFSGMADSLAGVTGTVSGLILAVWALALVILIIVFWMMAGERKREFAVLRLLGASRRMLGGMILKETAVCNLVGAAGGTAMGALILFPFRGLIEQRLGMPYLMPGAGRAIGLAAAAIACTVGVSAIASGAAVRKLSRVDAGEVLREGN